MFVVGRHPQEHRRSVAMVSSILAKIATKLRWGLHAKVWDFRGERCLVAVAVPTLHPGVRVRRPVPICPIVIAKVLVLPSFAFLPIRGQDTKCVTGIDTVGPDKPQ